MRRALVGLALGLMAVPAGAQDIEITRTCLPGFCVESRAAFGVVMRQPERGHYRLRVFEDDAIVYVQAGSAAFEHPCEPLCRRESRVGEARLVQPTTGRLVSRVFGPLAPCGEGPPLFVSLYLYLPGVNLARFRVERDCAALTPPRSRPSRRG